MAYRRVTRTAEPCIFGPVLAWLGSSSGSIRLAASYRQDLMLDGVVDGVAADEKAAKETLDRLQRYVREQPTVYLPAHDPGSNGRFSAKQIVPA